MLGPNGNGVRGQIIVGSIVAGIAAYFSVKFLLRCFKTRTVWPFGVYSLVVGIACIIKFS
jgi:undecaprenyl-diphosphatase